MNYKTEMEMTEHLITGLPKGPWTLSLNNKTKETEVRDRDKQVIFKIPHTNQSYLLLANFITHAPTRFATLLKLLKESTCNNDN